MTSRNNRPINYIDLTSDLSLFTMDIVPDEDITGFIVRQAYLTSNRVQLMRDVHTKKRKRPAWVMPWGLARLSEKIRTPLPSPEEMLLNHTRYRLLTSFTSPEDTSILKNHHLHDASNGAMAVAGMMRGLSRGRMAICPECIADDEKNYGYATWRRQMLMPGIFVCHIHNLPLRTFCDYCETGHRRVSSNWHPSNQCCCGGPLKEIAVLGPKERKLAFGVAQMANIVLQGNAPQALSASGVRTALRKVYGTSVALNSSPGLRLREAFIEKAGATSINLLNFGTLTFQRMICSQQKYRELANPIQQLAAIYIAFDDFSGYEAVLGSMQLAYERFNTSVHSTSNNSTSPRRRLAKYKAKILSLNKQERDALRAKYRKWVKAAIRENPLHSRTQIALLPNGRTPHQFLRFFDSIWFDAVLPCIKRTPPPPASDTELPRRILQLRAHILKRKKLFYKNLPFKRLTKSFLLSGYPCEMRGNTEIRSKAIQSLLQKTVDTPDSHRIRQMELICDDVTRICPTSTLGDISTYRHLKGQAFANRLARARQLLRSFE